jgi:beta-phosphoglucomutase-like phosphatase (HAD superfamily)
MDGTLVDTEPYWIACEHALVDGFGGTWTDADAHSVVGFDLLDAATELRHRGGVPLEPPEIVEHLLDGVIARVEEHLPWRPGAPELLAACAEAAVPCGLVTMSWERLAKAVVAAAPVGSFECW